MTVVVAAQNGLSSSSQNVTKSVRQTAAQSRRPNSSGGPAARADVIKNDPAAPARSDKRGEPPPVQWACRLIDPPAGRQRQQTSAPDGAECSSHRCRSQFTRPADAPPAPPPCVGAAVPPRGH